MRSGKEGRAEMATVFRYKEKSTQRLRLTLNANEIAVQPRKLQTGRESKIKLGIHLQKFIVLDVLPLVDYLFGL